MKVLIIYDTKYGTTKKAAELIGEGLNSAGETDVTITNVSDVEINSDITYDLIVIGSPTHAGSHTQEVRKFITNLKDSKLKGKSFASFDTNLGKIFGTAAKKIENHLLKVLPDLTLKSPGLAVRVKGFKGPIVADWIPKCKEFGKNLNK